MKDKQAHAAIKAALKAQAIQQAQAVEASKAKLAKILKKADGKRNK